MNSKDKRLLRVYEYSKKKRYGNLYDGGYVIAQIPTEYDCYISCGVETDESFSRDFLKDYHIPHDSRFAFDGTINEYPDGFVDDIHFVKKNIGRYNTDTYSNLKIYTKMYSNIFMKMDIEGGEYDWLKSMSETQLKKFGQIVIEFHGICTGESWGTSYSKKMKCIQQLLKTHYIVHAHGNNHSPIVNGIPDVIELTFVNNKFMRKHIFHTPKLNTYPLPTLDLDYPNKKTINDYSLNHYPFVHLK